jgi:GDP-L-fucose synthase
MNLTNKTILVTGANGLVGIPTVTKILNLSPKKVIAVDINIGEDLKNLQKDFNNLVLKTVDIRYLDQCETLFNDDSINCVFHLAGIKGSPLRAKNSPSDYIFPMIMFDTNMIKTSFSANVDWFVYTSSVGVYEQTELMIEDDVWTSMPSKNDWFPGWGKRVAELNIESLKVQYNWNKWTIIRPANIYGVHDNFSKDATVIGSNIWKVLNTQEEIILAWGDGSSKRDFVFGDDVADAVINSAVNEVNDIVNFGSGNAVTIKETIETIVEEYYKLTGQQKKIEWDISKPNGDKIRLLDSQRQIKYNLLPKISLKEGIHKILKKKL